MIALGGSMWLTVRIGTVCEMYNTVRDFTFKVIFRWAIDHHEVWTDSKKEVVYFIFTQSVVRLSDLLSLKLIGTNQF